MTTDRSPRSINSLYAEVTSRIIAELEAGRLPWVQPWDGAKAGAAMPCNAGTRRRYSGINVLILWASVFERGYSSQRWLTYKQAQSLGGSVRSGERGTTVCYADRFTPKGRGGTITSESGSEEQRQIAFLKRFTVFNIEQCEGLPADIVGSRLPAVSEQDLIPQAFELIKATGADFRIGGEEACYVPSRDYVQVPPQGAFYDPVNWYRTALHELGHWTGHASRLDRLGKAQGDRTAYAREELVAEMCSAFTCAELGIIPTVRHADYIGAWLEVLRHDSRAIFRAASHASKAAEYLLAFREGVAPRAPEQVAA